MTAGPSTRSPRTPASPRRPLAAALVALLATAVLAPPAVAGQERERACRCVDENGREIPDCRCMVRPEPPRVVRVPRVPRVGVAPMPPMPPVPEMMAWRMVGGRRARLGVTLGSPERDVRGAPVTAVMEGGAAERAGLRVGDLIVALDGHDLAEPVDEEREGRLTIRGNPSVPRLLDVLGGLEPGEEVEVVYERDGQRRSAVLVPEENPQWEDMSRVRERLEEAGARLRELETRFGEEAPRAFIWDEGDGDRVRRGPAVWSLMGGRCPAAGRGGLVGGRSCVAGAELVELNPALGEYFGASEGVLVPSVDDDSPLGLRAGDVILAVDGRAVTTPEEVRRILGRFEDEPVTLRVLRQRQTIEVRGRGSR